MVYSPPSRFNRIIRRALRIIARVIIIISFLIVIILFLLQTAFVQNFARKKIQAFLESKMHSKVVIGGLSVDFPKKIVLKDIYLEDLHKDTLLSAGYLNLDVDLWGLLKHKVILNEINLERWTINIERILPDSDFNYAFISRAFDSGSVNQDSSSKASQWQFEIGKIHLARIHAHFKDDASGNDATIFLNDLQTRIKTFDLNEMIFSIPEFAVSGFSGHLKQYQPTLSQNIKIETDTTDPPSKPLTLELGKVGLNALVMDYANEINGTKANLNLGLISSTFERIDLQNMEFDLKELKWNQSTVSFETGKSQPSDKQKKTSDEKPRQQTPWSVKIGRIDIEDNDIKYDDNTQSPKTRGMDYAHLFIRSLGIKGSQMNLSSNHYQGNIGLISFSEKSGFELRKLSTIFYYDDRKASLSDLILQTNNSSLKNKTLLKYASISSISRRPGELETALFFDRSIIGIKDVLLLVPSLEKWLSHQRNGQILINGRINGKISHLNIPELEISGLRQTKLRISGQIIGLPDGKRTVYKVLVKDLVTSSEDIKPFLPENTIPKNIRLPENLSAKGNFDGSINQFKVNLVLNSSFGEAEINGNLNMQKERYDLSAGLSQFDLGKLLTQDSLLGKVDLHLIAKGNGFDFKKMNGMAHLQVPAAMVMSYQYKNLSMDLSMQNGTYDLKSIFNDQNLKWHLDAKGKMNEKYPSVLLNMNMDTINLHALHLIKDTLGMRFNLNADLANSDPDALAGKLYLTRLGVNYLNQPLFTDSVYLMAERKDSSETILLQSEMVNLDWSGRYRITELAQSLKQTINHYYKIPGFVPEKITPQNWELKLLLRPSPILLAYNPKLRGSDSVTVSMGFNSSANDLHLALFAPIIKYEKQFIRQLAVNGQTMDSALNYSVQLASANWAGFTPHRTGIFGWLANNQLHNTIVLHDVRDKESYHVATLLAEKSGGIELKLVSDSLVLNYAPWKIAPDNYIHYDSSGILVNNFKLNHGDESLIINSTEKIANAPVRVDFKDFHLRTITAFVSQDSLLLDGLMNGKIEIKDILKHPLFTSDLAVNELIFKGDSLGNMNLQIQNKEGNVFLTKINLKGHGNDVGIGGEFNGDENKMDLNIDLKSLNLALIKSVSPDQVRGIQGNLKGQMSAKGSFAAPALDGYLQFDSAYIIPTISGEKLNLPKDRIEFDEDGINFSQYTLIDSAGNKAILDGNIFTKDFKKYQFDLSFQADNFQMINAPKSPNSLFYGRLNMDAFIDIVGDLESPKVNAELRVNKKTDFTVILPSSDPEIVDRQGVVVFVDKVHPRDTVRLQNLLDSLARNSTLKGMDVSATIETDSNAQFTLVIDERNGDALALRGRADLAGGIDKSGKITLTGNYELENGSYNLSLSVLKRKFTIERGSTITWTGDPRMANIDIKATYLVNTAPIDLMEQQVSGLSTTEINRYKQKIPFQVNLIMKGELLKPIISFEITLPQDKISLWPEVDTKLQQMKTDQSEVNKQVFALLLLNRFVAENPFVSAASSTDAETLARQSASKILSDQINQFAASLIKGVDLTVDLNSDKDYSSGQEVKQTQLNVGVSKSLFSDRLRVTVGSNFQLEQTNPNQQVSNLAGDIAVDYKLTKDGRYMVRAYRKDQYTTVVEGQVVETGVSFILTFDYNVFYELFKPKKEEPLKKIRVHKKTETTNPGK